MADTEETKDNGASQADRLEALFQELGSLRQENNSLRQDVLKLALAPSPKYEPPATKEGGPDLRDLPDFNLDPDAHLAERDKRIAAYAVQKAVTEQNKPMSTEQRNKMLWDQFQEKYPDIAKDPERIEVAVKKAMDLGKAKGYDMEKYMYGHSEVFFEDVVKEHNRFFAVSAPEKKEKAEDKQPTEEETNEAWGIFGGSEGANATKKKTDDEELGSLTADIKKIQRDAGLSW